MHSEEILKTLKSEKDTQQKLDAAIATAKAEIAKAEKTRAKVAYSAETKQDPKSVKALSETEAVIPKLEQSIKSKEAALRTSVEIAAQLQRDFEAAQAEECWEQNVLIPYREAIEKDAPAIERHMDGGGDGPVEPFVPLVTNHIAKLRKVAAQLRHFGIEHTDAAALFKRWFDSRLHDLFRDSNRILYNAQTRELYSGSYIALLQSNFERVTQSWESKRENTKKAS